MVEHPPAVGLDAAIAVSGRIRSRTPLEQLLEFEVVDGRRVAADGVVLFFPQRHVTSVVGEWRPLANFFLDADAAAWAAAHDVQGQVPRLEQASERGTADWRDCC